MSLILIWQMISAFGSVTLIPLLKKIPWQVWAVVGGIVLVMLYGSYREKKGYKACEVKTEQAANKEIARQHAVAGQEILKAQVRAKEAEERAKVTEKDLENVNKEVAKLKTAKVVCLPGTITDRIRRMR